MQIAQPNFFYMFCRRGFRLVLGCSLDILWHELCVQFAYNKMTYLRATWSAIVLNKKTNGQPKRADVVHSVSCTCSTVYHYFQAQKCQFILKNFQIFFPSRNTYNFQMDTNCTLQNNFQFNTYLKYEQTHSISDISI